MLAYSPLCGHEYRIAYFTFFLNYLQLIVIGLLFEAKIKETLDSVWYRKPLLCLCTRHNVIQSSRTFSFYT